MRRTTELVKLFEQNGFTLARSKNHQIWRCPCGHATVATSGTPCGGRGGANAAAQIRRTLRNCKPEEEKKP